jgi:ribonuclease VapC
MATHLLDASAVLALMNQEPGDVDPAIAFAAAALMPLAQPLGLSLGDRICLATAGILGLPAVTSDRAWAGLAGIAVEVIR